MATELGDERDETRKMEERWDELMIELERVNKSFPSKEHLDGWAPKWADEKRKEAVAEKKINNMRVLKEFKPVGVWKDVYEILILKEKILVEMNRIAEKLVGPTIFTSKEFADDSVEL